MLNVPENLSGAVNRQTVLTINTKKVMEPLSSHSIGSINNMSCRNSPHTRSAPVTASSSVRATAPSADSSSVRTTAQSAARTVPILKNPARKGQKVSLETNARITGIRAYLGWDITNPECDVDVSAFLLNNTGKVIGDSWFVFYGQETSPDGSTAFGAGQEENHEIISVDFNRLNPAVSRIVFVLTINEALEKHLNFSMLRDAYIKITDTSDTELVSFKMDEYYSNVTSMMIGEVYRHNGIWKFNAIGNGVTGENIPLMKVSLNGDSVTYYANYGQHVVIYQLAKGETISVESENILAFTQDCDYSVRFIGVGVLSQKGLATSTLTARGRNAYVAVLSDGNPVVLSNVGRNNTISVDPDAVICWIGNGHCDPSVTADVSWKTFIGQTSGESYQFEWHGGDNVTVIIQPSERQSGIRVSMD